MDSAQEAPENGTDRTDRRWSILHLVGWALVVITIASACGRWHWTLDLAGHFVCYYAGLSVLVLAGVWKKPGWTRYAVALSSFLNAIVIVPLYITEPVQQSGQTTSLTIVSLNVLTSNPHKQRVIDYLRHQQADVIVLMEINDEWGTALKELHGEYPHFLYRFRNDNFGIGILSRRQLIDPYAVDFGNEGLPSLVATLPCGESQVQLIATHPLPPIGPKHTEARNRQLNAVASHIAAASLPCLVAGDFNTTPWTSSFRDLLALSGLKNSARGFGIQPSWNAKSWLMRIPIDHLLVPRDAIVRQRRIGPDVGSDHFPIEAKIELSGN